MVDGFLRNIKDAILGPDEAEQERDIRPASEDSYGDPADQYGEGQFGDVRPASEDPYGDPADQYGGGQFGDISPASEDPYGDPADQV
jgi:hypothetical protein